MTPSARDLRDMLEVTLDGVALNDAQRLACFNPDPEVNSLAERIVALRHHGVPDTVIGDLLQQVGEVLALNGQEGNRARTVAGQLDGLAAAAQHTACNGLADAPASLKKLAEQLRPHLAVLRKPYEYDGFAYVQASGAARRIIAACPRARLESPTVRKQLGKGPHAQLLALAASIDGSRS